MDGTSRSPNVLLIYVDDVGYGEFGCQGNPQIPTPNIDSIAANGVRFTQGYVTDSLCCPSRAGLMLGRHGCRVGHETNPPWGPQWKEYGLPLSEKIMANYMKEAGYATGMVGKWHLGYKPEFWPMKRGFDEYYGNLENSRSYTTPEILDSLEENPQPRHVKQDGYFSTFAYGERARDFISRNKNNPWFLYLAFYNQHAPVDEAPPGYAEAFPEIKDPKRRIFAGMMKALDEEVGKTLKLLRELNMEEDTLIFLISDNGGPTPSNTSVNGPLRGIKITQFEGGLRVPYMMQWKGKIPAGRIYEKQVSTLDVLPTALTAVGVKMDPAWKLEGVDLIPYITGNNAGVPHETLCWRRGSYRTIRQGDWKLLFRKGHPVQLYNLKNDIGEKNNLAETFPERVQNLRLRWQEWDSQNVDPLWLSGKYE
ncbi:sulfatase-like hydrolase/transferase [Tichowtungia aerotolerans]|uniref:Sulfatase-like hydrolase/transferase n=1 Tax=Tichowtungia aerotolerans TaxID=2697043 RepID=A0A6P1M3X2_9BACT|nr:sulfatase-like hydrolase/transferase [Tichowtungia aerotolerans]QHI68722.1 sulfatase-like hydrolase/transferase [Tichowtungia aerotolerans]